MKRVVGLVLLVAAIVGSCGSSEPGDRCWDQGRLKFERTAWIARSDPIGMLEDLVQHHLPAGMSRQAVIELLGQPHESTPEFIAYDVGGAHYFNVIFDYEGLLVRTRVGCPTKS